jgi:hypothetical protein
MAQGLGGCKEETGWRDKSLSTWCKDCCWGDCHYYRYRITTTIITAMTAVLAIDLDPFAAHSAFLGG